MKRILFASICGFITTNGIALPTFTITPNMATPSSYISGETGTAVYQVTNNSGYTLTGVGLARMPAGVTVNTNSVGGDTQYCTDPVTLTNGSSCLLKVRLNTGQLGSTIQGGPQVCFSRSKPVYCNVPLPPDQLNAPISPGPIPQDCNSNYANFNYELSQPLDSLISSHPAWGPARADLPLSPSNPNLTGCPVSAGVEWERQRIIAAAQYWIAQKLNYCHHYNPDWATPVAERSAGGTDGGYCNPAVDTMPGSVYYGQQARWNYSGQGGETAYNWVNNNRMWYGVDCSNYTAFLYNFAFGANTALTIPFDSQTGFQAGQSNVGCNSHGKDCPQDFLSPNQQNVAPFLNVYLNNDKRAGSLVCADGTVDANSNRNAVVGAVPTLCAGHGGYLSAIDSAGNETITITPAEIAPKLRPGDILFIAGGGTNPDGSSSEVTHAILWLGKQVGYGPNDINPALVAPDDGACAAPSIWQPHVGDWLINDSHYQGSDYRVLTSCFYLHNLWGVRRMIN